MSWAYRRWGRYQARTKLWEKADKRIFLTNTVYNRVDNSFCSFSLLKFHLFKAFAQPNTFVKKYTFRHRTDYNVLTHKHVLMNSQHHIEINSNLKKSVQIMSRNSWYAFCYHCEVSVVNTSAHSLSLKMCRRDGSSDRWDSKRSSMDWKSAEEQRWDCISS